MFQYIVESLSKTYIVESVAIEEKVQQSCKKKKDAEQIGGFNI